MSSPLSQLVSTLRKRTQLPLKDCKEALIATNQNIEEALLWLEQKCSRAYKVEEGLVMEDDEAAIISIAISENNQSASFAELRCRTAFAANTDIAKELLRKTVLKPFVNFPDYENYRSTVVGQLKEKISLSNSLWNSSDNNEFLFAYCHPPMSDNTDDTKCKVFMGRSMTLVGLAQDPKIPSIVNDRIKLGYKIAQHFHAFKSSSTESFMETPFLFDPNCTIKAVLDRSSMRLSRIVTVSAGKEPTEMSFALQNQ